MYCFKKLEKQIKIEMGIIPEKYEGKKYKEESNKRLKMALSADVFL